MSAASDVVEGGTMSRSAALVIASSAVLLPLAMSASSAPAPHHPRILFWYGSLRKPFFKPSDWMISAAWLGIETSLATAAYRLLRSEPTTLRNRGLALLTWNVVAIGGWSRLFFKHRSLGLSTVAAATMVVTGAEYIRQAKPIDPVAARAGIPFLVWVSFATVLTASIWSLNRHRTR